MSVISSIFRKKVKVKVLEGGHVFETMSEGACCFDCYARLGCVIKKGERALVPLGFAMELPKGYEAVIRPRSGLTKTGKDAMVGTIDWDYRGEVSVCIRNDTKDYFEVLAGDRICQLAIRKVPYVNIQVVTKKLSKTKRGINGFGSTGI